jgi:hypothetical protein
MSSCNTAKPIKKGYLDFLFWAVPSAAMDCVGTHAMKDWQTNAFSHCRLGSRFTFQILAGGS